MISQARDRRGRSAASSPHLWGIVLAGESNARLRETVERAADFVPRRRLLTVSTRRQPKSGPVPAHVQRVVQPSYRGSAAEILLPVLKVERRDPHAIVVILPGDLAVDHEARFITYLERAIAAVEVRPDVPVLLAAPPRTARGSRGWIEPGPSIEGLEDLTVRAIARFIERPGRAEIDALFAGNGLVSTRVVVAKARTLIELGSHHLPDVVEALEPLEAAFGRPEEPLLCDAIYECMPRASLWRALLRSGAVAVLPLPDVLGNEQGLGVLQALAS